MMNITSEIMIKDEEPSEDEEEKKEEETRPPKVMKRSNLIVCDICSYRYVAKATYYAHKKKQKELIQFFCTSCDANTIFESVCHLQAHKASHQITNNGQKMKKNLVLEEEPPIVPSVKMRNIYPLPNKNVLAANGRVLKRALPIIYVSSNTGERTLAIRNVISPEHSYNMSSMGEAQPTTSTDGMNEIKIHNVRSEASTSGVIKRPIETRVKATICSPKDKTEIEPPETFRACMQNIINCDNITIVPGSVQSTSPRKVPCLQTQSVVKTFELSKNNTNTTHEHDKTGCNYTARIFSIGNGQQPLCGGCKKVKCTECFLHLEAEQSLAEHLTSNNGFTYPCPDCDLIFTNECNLSAHQRLHSSETPYLCPDCGNLYYDQGNLAAHLLQTCYHIFKSTYYTCPLCKKYFPSELQFKDHLLDHVTPVMKCVDCKFTCNNPVSIKSHTYKVHKKLKFQVKVYEKCEFCPNKYFPKTSQHTVETHALDYTMTPAFLCSCNEAYVTLAMFKDHVADCPKHKVFQCNSKTWIHITVAFNTLMTKCLQCGEHFRKTDGYDVCRKCAPSGKEFVITGNKIVVTSKKNKDVSPLPDHKTVTNSSTKLQALPTILKKFTNKLGAEKLTKNPETITVNLAEEMQTDIGDVQFTESAAPAEQSILSLSAESEENDSAAETKEVTKSPILNILKPDQINKKIPPTTLMPGVFKKVYLNNQNTVVLNPAQKTVLVNTPNAQKIALLNNTTAQKKLMNPYTNVMYKSKNGSLVTKLALPEKSGKFVSIPKKSLIKVIPQPNDSSLKLNSSVPERKISAKLETPKRKKKPVEINLPTTLEFQCPVCGDKFPITRHDPTLVEEHFNQYHATLTLREGESKTIVTVQDAGKRILNYRNIIEKTKDESELSKVSKTRSIGVNTILMCKPNLMYSWTIFDGKSKKDGKNFNLNSSVSLINSKKSLDAEEPTKHYTKNKLKKNINTPITPINMKQEVRSQIFDKPVIYQPIRFKEENKTENQGSDSDENNMPNISKDNGGIKEYERNTPSTSKDNREIKEYEHNTPSTSQDNRETKTYKKAKKRSFYADPEKPLENTVVCAEDEWNVYFENLRQAERIKRKKKGENFNEEVNKLIASVETRKKRPKKPVKRLLDDMLQEQEEKGKRKSSLEGVSSSEKASKEEPVVNYLLESSNENMDTSETNLGNYKHASLKPRLLTYTDTNVSEDETPLAKRACKREIKNKQKPKKKTKVTVVKDVFFKCAVCEDVSKNKNEFIKHILTHRTDESFQCMECGICFIARPTLEKHLWATHNIINVKKYILENKCCDSMGDQIHLQDNQCKECFKQFDSSVEYNKHIRTHGIAFLKLRHGLFSK